MCPKAIAILSRTTHGQTPRDASRAFSLIELVAVVFIMGIMAATIAPTLGLLGQGSVRAAAAEVERHLELARARAIASGRPAGVTFNTSRHFLELIVQDSNDAIAPFPDLTGAPRSPFNIRGHYPGVSIRSFRNGRPGATLRTIWFDPTGEPHASRNNQLATDANIFTRDAIITLRNGSTRQTVRVRRTTGMVD